MATMTPEEKSLLERTYKMAEENNSILRSMRNSNRVKNFIHIGYWVLIVGLSFGAYYFIQPYLQMMLGVVGQGQTVLDSLKTAI